MNFSHDNNDTSYKRIEWLDIFRGIGLILMVFGHICYSETCYRWIYSFHMAIFFFAAGFVYRRKSVIEDIKHRARTILLPYIIFGFITLIYWYFVESHFKDIGISFIQGITGLLIGRDDTLSFNIPLWFLPCFFITMVIYNIIRSLLNKRLSGAFIIALTIVYIIVPFKPMLWGMDKIFKYIAFVILGEYSADSHILNIVKAWPQYRQAAATAVCLFANIILCIILAPTREAWFITAFTGCIACIFLAMFFSNINTITSIFTKISHASMIILCLHGAIYRALIGIITHIAQIDMDILRANYIYCILITGITILVCVAIQHINSHFKFPKINKNISL